MDLYLPNLRVIFSLLMLGVFLNHARQLGIVPSQFSVQYRHVSVTSQHPNSTQEFISPLYSLL